MDIPSHILDAVTTLDTPSAASHRFGSTSSSPTKSRFHAPRSAHSSLEDLPSSSDSEQEHDYQTDFTSQPSSDTSPEDMQAGEVEDFRDREYPQLKGKTYLDHGGTTLYARSLVEEFSTDLISNLYGNPHSASKPSAISGHRVDAIRERALRFFNADPDDFDLVFVANATAAIKLVIECFRDYGAATNTPVWYGYHRDAHTSLVGVRETTKMHRCFTSDEEVDLWINSGGFGGPRARQLGLFAYPGQSNMTGRRLPLNWSGRIRKSFHKSATYTLLDAAALASTAPLDLSDAATAPDFVALSFYKIFGFPNIGALLVRKDSAHVLQSRRYFGGGTVDMIITINDTWHAKKDASIHDRLEDGTLPFHSIFALDHAMNVHERLYGPNPMKRISEHTAKLGKMLYDGIVSLKHVNGTSVCKVYKDEVAVYGEAALQGATIAFNVIKSDGSLIGYEDVEEAADERNIFVRSGSLCNPGGMASYLGWSPAEMRAAWAAGHRCSNPTQIMLGRPTGVVRVSLGAMSTASDVRTLVKFLEESYLERQEQPSALPLRQQRASHLSHSMHMPLPSMPASPSMPVSPSALPQLHTLGISSSSQHTPSTAASAPDADSGVALESVERPRFIPADYIKIRRPWEDEMRKPQYASGAGGAMGMEIKVREMDDASAYSRNPTPSVKARKFGRSVVNLLRTKSQFQDTHTRPPLPSSPIPPSPLPPPADGVRATSDSQRSKRSMDKANFQVNLEALGM